METNNARILSLLKQKDLEFRKLLEEFDKDTIDKALEFLNYRRELVARNINIPLEESLQKLDSKVRSVFELMERYVSEIKEIFISNGGILTHITDVPPEEMNDNKIHKSFNRANNYETERGNWLFAGSAPVDKNNIYLARKPVEGMIYLSRGIYVFGGDNMVVRQGEDGEKRLFLREPNYIYRINPQNFSPVVMLMQDKEGKPFFEFSEEWISEDEIDLRDTTQFLGVEEVTDVTNLLYSYHIFCDVNRQGLARRLIKTGNLTKGLELLNKYVEDGSLLYMNSEAGINVSTLVKSAIMKAWREKILAEIEIHFEDEVAIQAFENQNNGEVTDDADTLSQKYIEENGGLDNIVQRRLLLDEAFQSVIEVYNQTNGLPYFERKEKVGKVLKEFYGIIKNNFKNKDLYWEYSPYIVTIRELSRKARSYPFEDEIEHPKSDIEPEKTLDTLVSTVRENVCKRYGEYHFYNTCVECQKTFNDLIGKNNGILNKSFDTEYNFGLPNFQHSFNLVKINDRFFVVDMTFAQFCEVDYTLDVLGVPGLAGANPGMYLMEDKEKLEFLRNLIRNGYFEATEENIKFYFDAFILANRNSDFYRSHPSASQMSTEISAKDYVKALMGGKKIEFGDSEEFCRGEYY